MAATALIDGLNEQQRDIVFAPLQDILVVAGAGTGKTRVLVSRIAYMVDVMQYRPYNIVAMTFTNKAAQEMGERLQQIFGWDNNEGMWINTFHSFCYRLLRRYYQEAMLPENFSLISTSDQESIMRHFYESFGFKSGPSSDLAKMNLDPRSIIKRIMYLKDEGMRTVDEDEAECQEALENFDQIFSKYRYSENKLFRLLFRVYELLCAKAGVVDFADLINKVIALLRDNTQLRTKLQQRFRYICVDEFQDTNLPQYQLLMLLKSKHNHLFLVGDDDQSIYGWRGARVENLEDISRDLPDITIYALTINYRSTRNILNFSNALISINQGRLINKFLVNESNFQRLKAVDMLLLQKLFIDNSNQEKLQQALLQSRWQQYASLDLNLLQSISPQNREDMLQYLVQKNLLPYEDVAARDEARWANLARGQLEYPLPIAEKLIAPCLQEDQEAPLVTMSKYPGGRGQDGKVVLGLIKSLHDKYELAYDDIAVLYRKNSLSSEIETELANANIKYQIYGGIKFYERAEILAVMGYLRLIVNAKDNAAFNRVVNLPRRGIGPARLSQLAEFATMMGLSYYEALLHLLTAPEYAAQRKTFKVFKPFVELIEGLKREVPHYQLDAFVQKVIGDSGLLAHFIAQDQADKSARIGKSREDNLQQLVLNAATFIAKEVLVGDESDRIRDAVVKPFASAASSSDATAPYSEPPSESHADADPAVVAAVAETVADKTARKELKSTRKSKTQQPEQPVLQTAPEQQIESEVDAEILQPQFAADLPLLMGAEHGAAAATVLTPETVAVASAAAPADVAAPSAPADPAAAAAPATDAALDAKAEVAGSTEGVTDGDADAAASAEDEFADIMPSIDLASLSRREQLAVFVANATLASSAEQNEKGNLDRGKGVQLMTIHASKGLEFPAVIVMDCENTMMPSTWTIENPQQIEEERRLAYVAFTRARKYLMVTFASNRFDFTSGRMVSTGASVFLHEIVQVFQDARVKGKLPYGVHLLSYEDVMSAGS